MAEQRISEPEHISIETSKTEKLKRKKDWKKKNSTECIRALGQLQKLPHTFNRNTRRRRHRKGKIIIWNNKTEHFSQLALGTKSQILETPRTPNRTNAPSNLPISMPNYRKSKINKKSWKKPEGEKNHLHIKIKNAL